MKRKDINWISKDIMRMKNKYEKNEIKWHFWHKKMGNDNDKNEWMNEIVTYDILWQMDMTMMNKLTFKKWIIWYHDNKMT